MTTLELKALIEKEVSKAYSIRRYQTTGYRENSYTLYIDTMRHGYKSRVCFLVEYYRGSFMATVSPRLFNHGEGFKSPLEDEYHVITDKKKAPLFKYIESIGQDMSKYL